MIGLWRRAVSGYVFALAAVAVVSVFVGLVLGRVTLANASMLYLLAVMATAVARGRGPAIFASVLAFLVFDWFFVEPLHLFTVSDPEEWVSLLLFLLTAIVTGQLAADQRRRAQEARQRQREAVVLYDVVRLLSEGHLETTLPQVAARLRDELQLEAVAVELWRSSGEVKRYSAGNAGDLLDTQHRGSTRVLQAGRGPSYGNHALPGRWVRIVDPTRQTGEREDVNIVPVRIGDHRVGALLFAPGQSEFTASDDRLLSAAAAQIALAVERERLDKEATEAEILRRTDQLRAALLSAVSHDLRTPLATIMASAGSLRQKDVPWSDDDKDGFAQAIEEEADHLNHLVGNLLDISRIEGGSLKPQMSWHDLETVVEDVLVRLAPVTRQHRLKVTIAHDLPPLWLDSLEIGEVLYNLIENATKYAPPESEIAIDAQLDGDFVRVQVSDNGPGIPPMAMQHLFDPFYRAIDGKPRPHGLGLGLAIVKGLVEAHGGRVWAENRAGSGARFTFTLPVSGVGADVQQLPDVARA